MVTGLRELTPSLRIHRSVRRKPSRSRPQLQTRFPWGAVGVVIARGLNSVLPQFWFGSRRNRLRNAIMRMFVRIGLARIGRQQFPEAPEIRERFKESNDEFARLFLKRQESPFS